MSDFAAERNEYKSQVGRQKEAIENLLDLSRSHSGLFSPIMIDNLEKQLKKCERIYNKLDRNEFEIAIVGLEKAGKSTFGNALMENRILPDADERCTYTSTCIKYGQDRAVVKFFSSHEIDLVLRGYLKKLGVENVDSYTYSGMSRYNYLALWSGLDARTKESNENTVHQDILNLLDNKEAILAQYIGKPDKIFTGEALASQELKAYIVSPSVAVAVKEVSIETSKLDRMKNAVIYDVPGFDSPTDMHQEQTKERMKEADAIFLIASAEKPSFTAPALKMFREVVDEDNVSLGDKLFIFGNRADAANTLAKNIGTLKSDIRKWKLLSDGLVEDRLVIGSAKAHLQAKGLDGGRGCIDKVNNDAQYKQAWSHGDGIEYAYQKLVDYNENERFEVVKKKIRRNNEELLGIINTLKEQYAGGTPGYNTKSFDVEKTSLIGESRKVISRALEELREEVRSKYGAELILSRKLQDAVSKMFTDNKEKYEISDDDIYGAKLKIDDLGGVNVEKVDENVREVKFKRLYDDFTAAAFSVADGDHRDYAERIIGSFETALGICKGKAHYEELHDQIVEFIDQRQKGTEAEFYYQSLIERFVRDLMDVLVRRPYTSEARLNKFVQEAEIFCGLVMFYNPGDAEEGYKRLFLSIAPNNQPLLLALVFHDYKESDRCTKDVLDGITKKCPAAGENPEVQRLVCSTIRRDPVKGTSALNDMVKNLEPCPNKSGEPDRAYISNVIGRLRECHKSTQSQELDVNRYSDFDFTNKEKFLTQYKQFFGNTPVRTYDDVQAFLAEDLEILEKFLIHASIPAIRMEKPFVAREVQIINRLLELVDSREYEIWIIDRFNLLLPEAAEVFSRELDNFFANREAVKEVDKILQTISAK